jgi:diguanylate cyclase (GGDEF)-like protein
MSESTQFNPPSLTDDDPDEDKRPCLIMIKGDFIGQVHELAKDVTMVGRSDDVDLVVSDVSMSHRHAMIVNRTDGFHISDLGSTNGTFVNREVVDSPTALLEGDKVTLGNVTFKFTFQDKDDTQYHQMMRNMAIKDGLTQIYNKRYFMDVLEKEFDYNQRNKVGLGIILFDIDDFKIVNDTHGHPAGDYILQNMAQLIDQAGRGYDVFARWGGEEFVMMMRSGTLDSAVALAERVRLAIEDHDFEYGQQTLNVTVSLGVAFWNGDDRFADAEAIIKAADVQLYAAKAAGKNCVSALT